MQLVCQVMGAVLLASFMGYFMTEGNIQHAFRVLLTSMVLLSSCTLLTLGIDKGPE